MAISTCISILILSVAYLICVGQAKSVPIASENKCQQAQLKAANQLNDTAFDGVLLIVDSLDNLKGPLAIFRGVIENYLKLDASAASGRAVSIMNIQKEVASGGRLILSMTGPLNRDYDDVRRFSDAAQAGARKALSAGIKNLLIITPEYARYPTSRLVCLLGVLHTAYKPLEVRELPNRGECKFDLLGLWSGETSNTDRTIRLADAIEAGKLVARDIAGSDPERMTPARTAEYVIQAFPADRSSVQVEVIDNLTTIERDYPLLNDVNRAANAVPRHQPRVIKLLYEGEGPIEETLMFVGKGVTIDTGGVDVKTGGTMVDMSRDKSGAAAVAGFFKVLDKLKPKGLKVVGMMSMVRNSVGPEGYTTDEIVTARSGRRVRVVNTDAEGRMIMVDPLCELKTLALNEKNPHLFTIATLTGHARSTVGDGYSIALDNGPAEESGEASSLSNASVSIGDMIEVSRLRREDYDAYRSPSETADLIQAAGGSRGHQGPTAFLIMGSGLDEHGIDSKNPLKYTHIDMAGASGRFPNAPYGCPVAALTARYVIPRL